MKTKVFFPFWILAVLSIFGWLHPSPALASSQGSESMAFSPSYLKPLEPGISIRPLLTVPEARPQTRDPSKKFRLIGIPDGMGIREEQGRIFLWVNHELRKADHSEPFVDGPSIRGAFISEWVLFPGTGEVLSGDLAYDSIQKGTDPAPVFGAFGRFCSSSLAGALQGFDRWIYFTGEESSGEDTFDGRGGQAVAVADRRAYLLPELGRFQKENVVPVPTQEGQTLLFALEDGPKGFKSQLYLYVGQKNPSSPQVLERNGLVGGHLYVWSSVDPKKRDEGSFHKGEGRLEGRWVALSDAKDLDDEALNRLSEDSGSFNFARIEDGGYDRKDPSLFYFVTTGGEAANQKGRLYKLSFSQLNPISNPAFLEVMLEGDRGDPIYNPDNLDLNEDQQMILLEDPIKRFWGRLPGGRDSSVWLYDLKTGKLKRIAEIDQKAVSFLGRVLTGSWETSGVVDASKVFGQGAWLLNVQAHTRGGPKLLQYLKLVKPPVYLEGGQILLLRVPPD